MESVKEIYKKIEILTKEAIDKIEEATRLADDHGLDFSVNIDNAFIGTYKGRYLDCRWESSDPYCSDNRGEWCKDYQNLDSDESTKPNLFIWILWHFDLVDSIPSNPLLIHVFSSKEKAIEHILKILSNSAHNGGPTHYQMDNFDNLICFKLKNEYYEISKEKVV